MMGAWGDRDSPPPRSPSLVGIEPVEEEPASPREEVHAAQGSRPEAPPSRPSFLTVDARLEELEARPRVGRRFGTLLWLPDGETILSIDGGRILWRGSPPTPAVHVPRTNGRRLTLWRGSPPRPAVRAPITDTSGWPSVHDEGVVVGCDDRRALCLLDPDTLRVPAVALRELEHELGLEGALDVQVQLGLG